MSGEIGRIQQDPSHSSGPSSKVPKRSKVDPVELKAGKVGSEAMGRTITPISQVMQNEVHVASELYAWELPSSIRTLHSVSIEEAVLFDVRTAARRPGGQTPERVDMQQAAQDAVANDVYMIKKAMPLHPAVVFKPGPAALTGAISYGLAKLNDLQNCVAPTERTTINEIVSRRDLDSAELNPDGTIRQLNLTLYPKGSQTKSLDDPDETVSVLVNPKLGYPFGKTVTIDGEKLSVELNTDDVTYILDGDDDVLYRLVTVNGKKMLFEDENVHELSEHEDESLTVERNGRPYDVIVSDKGYQVIGHKIPGMVQLRVKKPFIGENPKVPLNTRSRAAGEETDRFYDRISTTGFIHAFVSTILLRPQDGKIGDLSSSNYLFIDAGDGTHLRPIMIDLDETLPADNALSQSPELTSDGDEEVHAIRNGLMGFPLAHQKLSLEMMERLEEALQKVIDRKEACCDYLKELMDDPDFKGILTEEKIAAYQKVVDRLASYLEMKRDQRPSTLAGLFFHVFPEYEQLWNAPDHAEKGRSNEEKALLIGWKPNREIAPSLYDGEGSSDEDSDDEDLTYRSDTE